MRILPFLTMAGIMALAQPVWAAGYLLTYESGKLSPYDGMDGVKGVKRLEIAWAIPTLPLPGRCTPFTWQSTIISYTDGKNSMESLLAKYGYNNNKAPYVSVCLKRDLSLSQSTVFVLFLDTNNKGVNYSEYFSAHAPADYTRNSILSITKYKNSQVVSSFEDESHGGHFTLSTQ